MPKLAIDKGRKILMFGPDSSKNGFENLPIIIDKFMTGDQAYQFWKEYFKSKGLKVIEMSAKENYTSFLQVARM